MVWVLLFSMFASLDGAACLAAVWMRICMRVCKSGQYERGGGRVRGRVFIRCHEICVWMNKTNCNNNDMVYLDTGLHSCVHKNVLFTWYMLCRHTHTNAHEGRLRWRIFKIKVFLPQYTVLCVLSVCCPERVSHLVSITGDFEEAAFFFISCVHRPTLRPCLLC